ncbi:PepSY domain-containing protein [Streptomyces sp. ME19-01-6]|uniref:PepSY domain-containing protein n=1 Tax=Streptomyces sp. ME19-01-6 TaxID=3028686 RepID=UPI0029A31FB2|nr:PepSY domain-containing protein [Streptomyces sp. ME19-01-6]MDX3225423.1 PepSY domain-containing protein [Streptomyces sp. ME19-01-6]
MKRTTVIAALAATALAAGAASAVARPTAPEAPATQAASAAQKTPASVSLAQAAEAARKAAPGTVTSIERDDDRPGWEVDVLGKDNKWHEVRIGANGKVLGQRVDTDDDAEDKAETEAVRAVLRTAEVGAVAAADRAGATATSVELEDKVWEVELAHKTVNVDPRTGAVTPSHDDDSADED